MKTITILLFFISSFIYSQSGWQVIYSGETYYGQYYYDLTFPASQTGWVLCRDHIKRTTNGGSQWKRIYFEGSYNYLRCSYFLNENTAWVVINNKLKFTSNGGDSWTFKDTAIGTPNIIYFYNINSGWLCGNGGMLKKTSNGGLTWDSVYSGTTEKLNAVNFGDQNNGVCSGDWGTILSTTNGGQVWTKFTDILIGFFNNVKFTDPQTVYVSGTGGRIFKSTNAGLNWNSYFIENNFLNTVLFSSSLTGFAFSGYHEVYKSTNSGLQWNFLQPVGINSKINRAAVSPDNSLWIAADSGIIYRSTTQGVSWNEIYRDYITKENLNSTYFLNNNTGIICGNHGVILRSVNSGINWNLVTTNSGLNFTDVQFTDNYTGFICGGNGTYSGIVLKTTDAGISWHPVYQNDSAHFYAMHFINNQTGWVTGRYGIILKTTTSGSNWYRYRPNSTTGTDIFFINENTGFIAKSSLQKSTDGGTNWITSLNITADNIQFFGQLGYFVAQNGLLYKTTDEGLNWAARTTGFTSGGSLFFINPETGWLCAGGLIRKTTNGGINWVLQTDLALPLSIYSVYFNDINNGWASGSYGGIVKTTNGGIGITQISSEIPVKHYLYQNFPNPFNPVTKIRFSIPLSRGVSGTAGQLVTPRREGVLLKIYDVLGKEISVLVNEILKPGIYEINWDASNYSSGVYFYSLITNEFTQTKKMVVVK